MDTLRRAPIDDTWRRLGIAILGVKARTSRNRIAVTRRKNPVLTAIHFLVALPIAVGVLGLLTAGFSAAIRDAADRELATTMLAAAIAVFALGAFIGSSTAALQALFLADDIPFLLSLPIPLRALFAGKLIDAAVGVIVPGMVFVAATTGFGIVFADSGVYWLIGLITGVSMAATATAVSVIVVSAVARFIPPRKARIFLLLISVALIGGTVAMWQSLMPQPESLANVVDRQQYMPLWNALAWTPIGWSAKAMSLSGEGNVARALVLTSEVAAVAAISVAISFHVFRRTFVRGLSRTHSVQTSRPSETVTCWLGLFAKPLPRRLGALVLKEWLVQFRDLRRLSGAIWPVGIVLVYAAVLGHDPENAWGSGDLAFWSRNGFLALLPWGLSLGISVYSYGSEGRNIQLLRTLPFSAGRLFLGKALASLLPVALLSLGASAAILWLRAEPMLPSLQLLGLICWMVTGYVTIDTASAAIAPNFDADHVQRTIGLTGRLFGFAVGSIFAIATLAAAGVLVLSSATPPESMSDIMKTRLSGLAVFGWPLAILFAVGAVAMVGLAASMAVRRTRQIVWAGA